MHNHSPLLPLNNQSLLSPLRNPLNLLHSRQKLLLTQS
jgi:hypothetical protein